MKQQSLLIAAFLLSAPIVHSQTQSSQPQSGQTRSGQGAPVGKSPDSLGAQQQAPAANQNAAPQTPINRDQPWNPQNPQPDERILLENQQAQQPRFGATNQAQFGATNPAFGTTNPPFGTTNPPAFGRTNVPPDAFATNQVQPPVAGRGAVINEAAGTRATNQLGQTGGAADQIFSQQLRAAMARTGATQIFFPQTRSTITVVNQNGAVTLRGYVASEEERRSIEARIQNTPGITAIDNQLQLASGPQRGIDPTAFPAPGVVTNRQAPAPAPRPAPTPPPMPTP